MSGNRCKDKVNSLVKMTLPIVIFVAFLPESQPKPFSIDWTKELTKEKHNKLQCNSPFDEVRFTQLTITCFLCYKRSESNFEYCRSNCFSTLKYKECIKMKYPLEEGYYLKLTNEYNRNAIFSINSEGPFLVGSSNDSSANKTKDSETTIEFGCPTPFEEKILQEINLACYFCYFRHGITEELDSCRAKCFSTLKYKECIYKTYENKEYYLNLSNSINNRIIFPHEEDPIITYEPFPVQTLRPISESISLLESFSLNKNKEFNSKKHKELNCTSPFHNDIFTILTLLCYSCYSRYSKDHFESCRWECFSTPKFQDCIRKIDPMHEDYYLQKASDYNQRTVPSIISEIYTTTETDKEHTKFYLSSYEHTEEKHKQVGCTSPFQMSNFTKLTMRCYECYNTSEADFYSCRSECFSTPKFRECVMKNFPGFNKTLLQLAKDYKGEVQSVTASEFEPHPFTTAIYDQFSIVKDVDGSMEKHKELRCTSQYDQEKLFNLTILCYLCNSIRPSSMFEACRSNCFSTLHYEGCVQRNLPSYKHEYYYKLANDYNRKIIFPQKIEVAVFYLTHNDFTKDAHRAIGCTSSFVEKTFYHLTLLCYKCACYVPKRGFNECRSRCFSTEKFSHCVKSSRYNYLDDLQLVNDYNQKEVYALKSTGWNPKHRSPSIQT